MTVVVRVLEPADAEAAAAADRASMQTFWDAGIPLPDDPDEPLEGDLLLVGVLDGEVAGVACVDRHDDVWHLAQMSVHPGAQRRGVGTAMLLDVVARASAAGAAAVTLTTFRDVPFNGPFYARHGFEPVDESLHPWLAEARQHERSEGIDVLPRIAMRRLLGGRP